jgi:hypothetical protein
LSILLLGEHLLQQQKQHTPAATCPAGSPVRPPTTVDAPLHRQSSECSMSGYL